MLKLDGGRLDFDTLARLYETDPQAFEKERQRLITQEIESYPPESQESLRRFQWVLDMKRKRCKTPLEACIMFYDMLMDQVYGHNGLLDNLMQLTDVIHHKGSGVGSSCKNTENSPKIETKVIPFDKVSRCRS